MVATNCHERHPLEAGRYAHGTRRSPCGRRFATTQINFPLPVAEHKEA
jgi:hypothetical protein